MLGQPVLKHATGPEGLVDIFLTDDLLDYFFTEPFNSDFLSLSVKSLRSLFYKNEDNLNEIFSVIKSFTSTVT